MRSGFARWAGGVRRRLKHSGHAVIAVALRIGFKGLMTIWRTKEICPSVMVFRCAGLIQRNGATADRIFNLHDTCPKESIAVSKVSFRASNLQERDAKRLIDGLRRLRGKTAMSIIRSIQAPAWRPLRSNQLMSNSLTC